jgi:hypothetical protein
MKDADAILLGRRTYVTHAAAIEPMPCDTHHGFFNSHSTLTIFHCPFHFATCM